MHLFVSVNKKGCKKNILTCFYADHIVMIDTLITSGGESSSPSFFFLVAEKMEVGGGGVAPKRKSKRFFLLRDRRNSCARHIVLCNGMCIKLKCWANTPSYITKHII